MNLIPQCNDIIGILPNTNLAAYDVILLCCHAHAWSINGVVPNMCLPHASRKDTKEV